MPIKFDTTLMRLIKDVNEIKAALRHVTTNLPLFDIANENSPDALSTDQNNYIPGNYDVLRLNPTDDISITGFANGKKGRFLEVINVGTGRISYPDESASSIAINRIATPYDQTIVQLPNARVRFYYDSTNERWTVADLPNIQGQFGKYAIISHSSTTVQTVTPFANTQFTPDTVISDEWGYWNSGSKRFVVPTGESGLYSIYTNFVLYDSVTEPAFSYSVNLNTNISFKNFTKQGIFDGAFGARWSVDAIAYFTMVTGDYIEPRIQQNSSGNVDIEIKAINNPIFIFSKVA